MWDPNEFGKYYRCLGMARTRTVTSVKNLREIFLKLYICHVVITKQTLNGKACGIKTLAPN